MQEPEPFEDQFEHAANELVAESESAPSVFDSAAMPVKLLTIPREDLEHVENKQLDSAFEQALLRSGDPLGPIRLDAEQIAEMFGADREKTETIAVFSPVEASRSNKAVAIAVQNAAEDEDSGEIPVMPDSPTDEDLIIYAENHPAIKSILRLFRGSVVEVRKK